MTNAQIYRDAALLITELNNTLAAQTALSSALTSGQNATVAALVDGFKADVIERLTDMQSQIV